MALAKHYEDKRKASVVIFLLATTSVLPTLWGNFVFDDGEAIVKNEDVVGVPGKGELEQIKDIFKHDFWGVNISHRLSHKSYRPLTTLTYRLEYYLWGRNPYPFHLVNLVIHGANAVLVFLFLLKCVKHRPLSPEVKTETRLTCKSCYQIALWASMLFSVHPVHVEPLGAIVGRADLLASLIFLLGFCFACKQLDNWIDASGTAVFAVIGALFKETAIALAILVTVLDAYRNRAIPFSSWKSRVPKYVLILVLSAMFVGWRLWLQNGPPSFQPYDNPPAFATSVFTRVVNVSYIWMLNAFILICPIWLCYDWSMGCVPLIESWSDFRLLILIMFVCGCLRIAYLTIENRLIAVSALIFSSTFLPSSNLLFTVGFVLAERNLYLPSIGYCLFLAFVFYKIDKPKVLYFVLVMFYLRSLHRSKDWMDQPSLFRSGLKVCPNNAKVHYNLGTVNSERRDYKAAEAAYKTALQLRPDYYQAMNNLGNLLRVMNKLEEAEKWLTTAVTIKKDFAAAWMNLGIILSPKNHSGALDAYENALKFRKAYPDCEYNLGNLFLDMGNKEEALLAWTRATTLKPKHSQAWINKIILLEQENRLEEARDIGREALEFMSDEDTIHFILGNILGKLGEFEEAKESFQQAILLRTTNGKPIPPKYFSNLGVLYHRWGKRELAIQAYEDALKLEPKSVTTRKNLDMLLKKLTNNEKM